MTSEKNPDFWKRKLAAFLHDTPSKCLDIPGHEKKSETAMRRAGFDDDWISKYDHEADHVAAAADRIPFPSSKPSSLRCAFDGTKAAFHHPLNGSNLLKFHRPIESSELGEETEQMSQPQPLTPQEWSESEKWRARFFAHWRIWQRNAVEKDYRMGYLPADTRIPDHTIWNHMQIVSALAGCGLSKGCKPAFLRVKIGGVQNFIAQARSTRDLWSGSYLLSWLMAKALKALSAEIGPDAVIFPSLRQQPLFDLQWRDELWNELRESIQLGSYWDSFEYSGENTQALLTANLPNVFLAIVPEKDAAELGKLCAREIQTEWGRIAQSVWNFCDETDSLTKDEPAITRLERRDRFDAQIERALDVSWHVEAWPDSLEEALKLGKGATKDSPLKESSELGTEEENKSPLEEATISVEVVRKMAEESMPKEHRDKRCYTNDRLNNIGLAWSILVANESAHFDAVRHTNAFRAWSDGGWSIGTQNNKDVLNGREEAVAGGKEWKARCESLKGKWKELFRKDDWVGATTLVKRLWHLSYLCREWGFDEADFKMPNTRGVANHDPLASDPINEEGRNFEDTDAPKYYAVLALDGDSIGKWVSGSKTPKFGRQLADYEGGGSLAYFKSGTFGDFVEKKRPVSPSYHLQFSEALGNFALKCAARIVSAFVGRLIYAGGDDVMAMLPADKAIPCAIALRNAFRGSKPNGCDSINMIQPGFLSLSDTKNDNGKGREIPFIVPGQEADCSVGIAIAHFKEPLQDVVREAQAAEKRAKNEYGRSAVAVTLLKHSGETINWGTNWDDGGLKLLESIMRAMESKEISNRFPHALQELLAPYVLQGDTRDSLINIQAVEGFDAIEIAKCEFRRCANRQGRDRHDSPHSDTKTLEAYLSKVRDKCSDKINADKIIPSLIGLLKTAAFIARNKSEEK